MNSMNLFIFLIFTPLTLSIIIEGFSENFPNSSECKFTAQTRELIKRDDALEFVPFIDSCIYVEFSLHGGSMSSIHPNISQHFKHIRKLSLVNVGLETLSNEELGKFPNLETFNASKNQIKEIDSSTFEANKQMKTLNLSENKLMHIDPFMFENFTEVDLWNNPCIGDVTLNVSVLPLILQNCIKPQEIFCHFVKKSMGGKCEPKVERYGCVVIDGVEHEKVEKEKIVGRHLQNLSNSDVKRISIKSSNFTKIPKIFGEKFPFVEIFRIRAQLESLTVEDLKPFENLLTLKLEGNKIQKISSDTFAYNKKIISIDLSFNQISSIGVAAFSHLRDLRNLWMLENFCVSKELERENYTNAVIEEMEECAVNDAIKCDFIDAHFHYVNIIYICNVIDHSENFNSFHGALGLHRDKLTNNDVHGISLQNSNATSISISIHKTFPSLKLIRIVNNLKLKYIDEGVFDNFYDLEFVDLSNNRLTEVPRGIFKNNEKLKFVNFQRNQIVHIFESLSRFANLNFEGRKSESDKIFIGNNCTRGLREVSLSELSEKCFKNAKYNLMCSSSSRPRECLIESGNQLTELIPLDGVKNLSITTLDVRQTLMYNLPTEISKVLRNLELIYATNGRIRKLSRENFVGLSKLKFLVLKDNEIEEIDEDSFEDLINLEKLDLEGNPLKFLSAKVLEKLTKLRELNFDGEICDAKDESLKYENFKGKVIKNKCKMEIENLVKK